MTIFSESAKSLLAYLKNMLRADFTNISSNGISNIKDSFSLIDYSEIYVIGGDVENIPTHTINEENLNRIAVFKIGDDPTTYGLFYINNNQWVQINLSVEEGSVSNG